MILIQVYNLVGFYLLQVRYSYILEPTLQPYLVDCYVNSFSPGSIQAIWTVVFELDASTTATALETILLGSILDEQNGDGVLISGTETLGNLTLLVAAIDVDYIVVECPDGYCFNGASCSVILGSYVCSCPDGFYGNQCELEATTVVTTEGTTWSPQRNHDGNHRGTTEGTTEVSTVVTTESTTVMTTTTITPLTTDGENNYGRKSDPGCHHREDLEATVTERVYPTRPPVTPEPDDELSILELVLIIVGGASVLFLVLICCFCCCIFVSQRRPKGRRWQVTRLLRPATTTGRILASSTTCPSVSAPLGNLPTGYGARTTKTNTATTTPSIPALPIAFHALTRGTASVKEKID
ncbi:putative fibrillin-1 [Apostichopus japonicus]|uniref:Putative fibrillin-1 n=1 Tax=Stichopus japonicus TaxID=307972 RepID=A0A2G8LP95_STIJA|nr:putative fibrillin-1 [Apostichopus japonicus]